MLGNAGAKLSKMVELAEELYERVAELREQVRALRETTHETHDRVVALEDELARQRALLEAIAAADGVDPESVRSEGASSTGGPAATEDGAVEDR